MKVKPCYKFSLRSGSLMVAVFEIVFATLCAVFYILGISAISEYEDPSEIQTIVKNFRLPFISEGLDSDAKNMGNYVSVLISIFIVGLIASLLQIAISIVLIFAIKRGSIIKLIIWRGFKGATLILAVIYLIAMAIGGYSTSSQFFLDLTSLILHSYFWWVVHSYLLELKEEIGLSLSPSIVKIDNKIDITFPNL